MSHIKTLSLAALPILLALFFSANAFLQGNPGFRVDKTQNGLWISHITNKRLNDVKESDLIVAVDGIPYSAVLGQLILQKTPDKNKSITVLRNGKKFNLTLKTTPFTFASFLLHTWSHFLLILIFLILAVIAATRAPPSFTTRLFFLMLCGFATSIAATLVSHTAIMDPTLISMSFICIALSNWLAFAAWIHFAWCFPEERNLLKNHPWAAALFYILPPAISISGALFAAGISVDFWSWLQRLRNIFLPVIILATFTKHTIDVIKLPPQPARNQIKLPLAAYWFSFGPYLFFYLLPNLLIDHPLIHFRTVILTFLFLPMAYLFALLRYRLFQIDKMISRILAYIILIIIFTAVYSQFLIFLKRWLWQNQILSENLFLLFLAVIVAFFNPLAARLQRFIDRKIFGNQPISPLLFHKLSHQISSALDIPDLTMSVTYDLPKLFAIDRAAILTLNGENRVSTSEESLLDPQKWKNSALLSTFRGNIQYLHCQTVTDNQKLLEELQTIRTAGYSMVFSLTGSKSLIGLLFVGSKLNGRLFTNEDIHFLATLANHTGIALENSLRYASLAKSKIQLEELFEELLQQKKMAAIGEMSTILTHELRNPLAVIRSSAQHLNSGSRDPAIMDEMLSFIIEEVDSLNLTINSLLGFARHRPPEILPIDLQTTLPALLDKWQLSEEHVQTIRITCTIPEHLPTLHADMSQLGQILLNLIRNSEEAMGETGQITLLLQEKKDLLQITVQDTGPGIPQKQLQHVFDNFYSTKKQGLGLGLPACRQLIVAHGGDIDIRNRDTKGTEIIILLPFTQPSHHQHTPVTP